MKPDRRTFIELSTLGVGAWLATGCDHPDEAAKSTTAAKPAPLSAVASYEPRFDRVYSASTYREVAGKSVALDLVKQRARAATVEARQDIVEVDAFFDDHYHRKGELVLLGEQGGWLLGFCYRYLVDFRFPVSGRDGVGEAEYRNPRLTALGEQYPLKRHDTEAAPERGEQRVAWVRTFGEHDAALVYLPVSGQHEHLGIEDPPALVKHTLDNRSSIFGLDFILMSPESLALMQRRAQEGIDLSDFAAGLAVAALVLLPLLGPSIAAALPISMLEGAGRKLVAQALPLALRVGKDILLGEDGFVSKQLGEQGRLALLGVELPSSDTEGYALLQKFLEGLSSAGHQDALFVEFDRDKGSAARGQVFVPGSEMCLNVELLARGLVRLDMLDRDVLREFPELVTAALSAIEGGHNLAAAWADDDAEYVTQLRTLNQVVAG